ncbi:hypothetical protein Lqui_1155 [Legionella quinlivanii]|uniref:Uncharacterized protein n=1 Tax=Legionella quinlivanii TaxID=45073 RepID=A0A0W0Y5Q5_9GAMM|nr:hypothetical protein Lqui_1155 [Legionella quinlivanii]SEF72895.1 hypothetical protein SAMN02746093_00895 [Legionella quinlivanii DSM 21216]STY12189.1 Uncharacterised protein [Legionella quinlivanii]
MPLITIPGYCGFPAGSSVPYEIPGSLGQAEGRSCIKPRYAGDKFSADPVR